MKVLKRRNDERVERIAWRGGEEGAAYKIESTYAARGGGNEAIGASG